MNSYDDHATTTIPALDDATVDRVAARIAVQVVSLPAGSEIARLVTAAEQLDGAADDAERARMLAYLTDRYGATSSRRGRGS